MNVGEPIAGFSVTKLGSTSVYGQWVDALHKGKNKKVKLLVLSPTVKASSEELKACAILEKKVFELKNDFALGAFDYVEHAGKSILVYSLKAKSTLRDFLAQQCPMDASSVLKLAFSIYKGMLAVHEKGMVHRNISAETILYCPNDKRGKLIGVGFSEFSKFRTMEAKSKLVPYWSPETCLGGSNEDERSDLYSAAVLLFECLTGKTPFEGTFKEIKTKQITKTPPTLSSINSSFAPGWDNFFQKSLAKAKDKRFATTRESLKTLESIAKEMGETESNASVSKRQLPKASLPPPIPKKAKPKKDDMDEGLTQVEDRPLGFRNTMQIDEMLESGKAMTPAPPDEMDSGAFDKPSKPVPLESIGSLRDAAEKMPELIKTPTDFAFNSDNAKSMEEVYEIDSDTGKVAKDKRFPLQKSKERVEPIVKPKSNPTPIFQEILKDSAIPLPTGSKKSKKPKQKEKPKKVKAAKPSKPLQKKKAAAPQKKKVVKKPKKDKKALPWGKLALGTLFLGGLGVAGIWGIQHKSELVEKARSIQTSMLGKDETIVKISKTNLDKEVSAKVDADRVLEKPVEATKAETQAVASKEIKTAPEEATIETKATVPDGVPLRANGQPDRPSDLMHFAIQSTPDGATVLKMPGAIRMGTTPFDFETTADDGTVTFGLQKDGFRFQEVSFPADRGGKRSVILIPGDSSMKEIAPTNDKAAESVDDTTLSDFERDERKPSVKKKSTTRKTSAKKSVVKKSSNADSGDKTIDYEMTPLE